MSPRPTLQALSAALLLASSAGLGGCPGGLDCADVDGDLFCSLAEGGSDCNDNDATVHPGATEVCGDSIDQDCDFVADNRDLDGDGWVDVACGGEDCDDLAAGSHPAANEICANEVDEDCSGAVDDADLDGDGFIAAPCGGEDCDDSEQYVNPDRLERCDGLDNDCDGVLPTDESDEDGDGYLACDQDCSDGDGSVYPGASEGADGVDSNCDGLICEGVSGRGLADCLLAWLARYDDPPGCVVDTRAMDAAQPAVDLAVETAMGVGTADDPLASADVCLDAVGAVGNTLDAAGYGGMLEAVCIEGNDGEHLLVVREDETAARGGFVVLRLQGWQPRTLSGGQSQDVVLGAPQRDHADAPACGDADLYTFYMALREVVEGRVPRAFIANGFPRGAINPTGTGAESDLGETLPGLLEEREVDEELWPNRSLLSANSAGIYLALANPVTGSTRDAILVLDPDDEDALPHCVFGHPDLIGPDGHPCAVADDSTPYLDDIRGLHANDDWLVAIDAGSEPSLFVLALYDSGSASALTVAVDLSAVPSDRALCEPTATALLMEGDEGTLFMVDEGGTSVCGDGGVKLVRVDLFPAHAGTGDVETVDWGLQGTVEVAVDTQGNVVAAISGDGSDDGAQDLLAWPLALDGQPEPFSLLEGDDCRLVDSRFGVDHGIADVASLAFSGSGLLLVADRDGNELFGALPERGVDGAIEGLERLAETDLEDGSGSAVIRALAPDGDEQAWLLVDEDGGGRYDLVPVEVYGRGDLVQPGNDEERGRLTPYHQIVEAMGRRADLLHLQFHGYDEEDDNHAALEIPGLQPVPYHWAALMSPGLPWSTQTDSFGDVVLAFQQGFAPSGSEVVYPYPDCLTHHDLGARTNRQGQLLNYGELQDGFDGLARHYDDPSADPPGDEFVHVEWPLALREQLYDPDSQASIYLRAAMDDLVTHPSGQQACPFEPDSSLPALPDNCSLP